ncbi:MAG: SDR family NAD(P)-dependent oxidoreductase, partial [Pseudonocardia sp.]|nr:SDR family NAD(P)-dependent oxidoreductase [Pseudonocardia sp.]
MHTCPATAAGRAWTPPTSTPRSVRRTAAEIFGSHDATHCSRVHRVKRPSSPGARRRQQLHDRYGPCAVVTGASSGIGREIARRLAEAGFDLVLVARREPQLRELAADLTARHPVMVRTLPADLSTCDGVDAVTRCTSDLDIGLYVASAGFGTSGPFLDATIDTEVEMLRVNCEAVLRTSLVFGRRLADRGRGGLVLMSSIVAFQGMPDAAHYAATKAYVQSLAEALYVELAPRGVDVLAAAPGPTHSGFAERADMRMGRALTP